MKESYSVGEFKARFSRVLKTVEAGETVVITYGRNKRAVAVLTPPPKPDQKARTLGRHAGKFKVRVSKDWQMDDAELLES